MSQYQHKDGPVLVRIGYDRILNYVFCTIERGSRMLYSNLSDPKAGTEQQDVNYFRPILAKHFVTVPEELFEKVRREQAEAN